MGFDFPALCWYCKTFCAGRVKTMANDFRLELASALGIQAAPDLCAIQVAYNTYTRKMCPLTVETPLPETVSFLPENFPHLVKLQTQANGSIEWVNVKWRIVAPQLEQVIFSDTGYRCDPRRVHALHGVLHLLRRPHRIHRNLRHGSRAPGKIRGEHIYVRILPKNERWVAFTLFDKRLGKAVVTSSFYTSEQWLASCAQMPAIYTRNPGTP